MKSCYLENNPGRHPSVLFLSFVVISHAPQVCCGVVSTILLCSAGLIPFYCLCSSVTIAHTPQVGTYPTLHSWYPSMPLRDDTPQSPSWYQPPALPCSISRMKPFYASLFCEDTPHSVCWLVAAYQLPCDPLLPCSISGMKPCSRASSPPFSADNGLRGFTLYPPPSDYSLSILAAIFIALNNYILLLDGWVALF